MGAAPKNDRPFERNKSESKNRPKAKIRTETKSRYPEYDPKLKRTQIARNNRKERTLSAETPFRATVADGCKCKRPRDTNKRQQQAQGDDNPAIGEIWGHRQTGGQLGNRRGKNNAKHALGTERFAPLPARDDRKQTRNNGQLGTGPPPPIT